MIIKNNDPNKYFIYQMSDNEHRKLQTVKNNKGTKSFKKEWLK